MCSDLSSLRAGGARLCVQTMTALRAVDIQNAISRLRDLGRNLLLITFLLLRQIRPYVQPPRNGNKSPHIHPQTC